MSASREFFEQVVQPTCNECLASVADLRRSRLAAIVLHHMNDYWAVEHGGTPKAVYRMASKACAALALIADVADASKHGVLRDQSRSVSHADQVKHHPGALYGHGAYGMGAYNEGPGVFIHAHGPSGPYRTAFNLPMLEALEFWKARVTRGDASESKPGT
jgi:hypothetical protein